MKILIKLFVLGIVLGVISASVSGCGTSIAAKSTEAANPFCILGPLSYSPKDTKITQLWGDGYRAVYEKECE